MTIPPASPAAHADVSEYQWIVWFGAFAAFFAAFGIGANDVANAFATSVGSKALTVIMLHTPICPFWAAFS